MRFNFLLLPAVLVAMATATTQQQPADNSCCLPMKWHSRLLHTNEKQFSFLQTGLAEREARKPIQMQVLVNHHWPKFEIRSAGGRGSVVFWRGHMWLFETDATMPRHLNAVPQGYRPSGGFAPFFFRCLASENGFVRMNETHYRMTEPDDSPVGRRLGLSTVTDVFVVPLLRVSDRQRGGANSTCLLDGFRVTSRYLKSVPEKGVAIVRETDAYLPEAPSKLNWPDKSLTERTKAFTNYYHSLLRSGRIQVNEPHSTVPVTRRSGNSKLN